jgi:ribosome-associated toxin RatA of RatAB toxin-antitoxin module
MLVIIQFHSKMLVPYNVKLNLGLTYESNSVMYRLCFDVQYHTPFFPTCNNSSLQSVRNASNSPSPVIYIDFTITCM